MTYKDFKQDMLLLPKEQKNKIEELRNKNNIVGVSGGKDSLATCTLLHWLDVPFRTITALVWWKEGITGENPQHYEFLHEKVFPKLTAWGCDPITVRSKITAYEYMTTPITKSKDHPERVGKLRGFPLCNKCGIQRDCKTRPCEKFYKEQKTDYTAILGIAADEKDRLLTDAQPNKISLLELLQIAEYKTYGICAQEDFVSPTYNFSLRGGCWFCPNQKIQEWELLYRCYPKLWGELMEIQTMPNKVQENVNRTQTLYDIEQQIKGGVQQRIFMGQLIGCGGTE
jgi:3'-phosphoadenosine 5'-phosphosulfate sulfotransferase (PAPS reductase)/FAD synthetase